MNNIKLMICCHKPCEVPKNNLFLPIHVGKEKSKLELNIQGDNYVNKQVCDNISKYNSIYCEMTAWYWAWKNIKRVYPNIEYVGLCHYRRLFSDSLDGKCPNKLMFNLLSKYNYIVHKNYTINTYDLYADNINEYEKNIDFSKLENVIKSNDILVSKPVKIEYGTVRDLFYTIGKEHINVLENIVKNNYPELYQILEDTLNGNSIYLANMIVIKIDFLDEYCSIMFDILQKHIDKELELGLISDPLQDKKYSRVSGYLAELITSTYVSSCINNRKIGVVNKYFIKNT